VNGRAFKHSDFSVQADIDPETDRPTFDLNFKLDPVELTQLNDFVKAYAKFDFEGGTLALAVEVAAKNGQMKGYVKPVLDGMKIVNVSREIRNPLDLVWQSAIAGITRLFRNQPNNRLATRIPISGNFDNPKTAILPTLGNIFKNEFFRVFDGDLENSISLEDVSGEPANDDSIKSESASAESAAPKLPPGK
jgi:hypothetical protein